MASRIPVGRSPSDALKPKGVHGFARERALQGGDGNAGDDSAAQHQCGNNEYWGPPVEEAPSRRALAERHARARRAQVRQPSRNAVPAKPACIARHGCLTRHAGLFFVNLRRVMTTGMTIGTTTGTTTPGMMTGMTTGKTVAVAIDFVGVCGLTADLSIVLDRDDDWDDDWDDDTLDDDEWYYEDDWWVLPEMPVLALEIDPLARRFHCQVRVVLQRRRRLGVSAL